MATDIKPFKIHITDKQIDNLHKRLKSARFPTGYNEDNWQHGTNANYLQSLINQWNEGYDWRNKAKELNQYPQFTCELGGTTIHFFHIKSNRKNAIPILLTHGWPDSFLRYIKLIPLLENYDLVIPSIPGFAFSTLPAKGFVNNVEIAVQWHKLMVEVLGYKDYIASGGDVGRGVTHFLAQNYPNEIRGIHLTDVGIVRELIVASDESLSQEELDYKRRATEWLQNEGAYINIQSTKPQTLAYALSDSPIGMAAWITEKYHSWSDWDLLTMDDLLDCLSLYWFTNTGSTSIRVYHANSFTLPPLSKISVPVAFAAFKYDVLPVPKTWVMQNYPVKQYSEIPRGGHFTALEQPETFSETLIRFAESLQE